MKILRIVAVHRQASRQENNYKQTRKDSMQYIIILTVGLFDIGFLHFIIIDHVHGRPINTVSEYAFGINMLPTALIPIYITAPFTLACGKQI